MSKQSGPRVIVLATDPTGAQVAFETAGWESAHRLQQTIDSYYNRLYGWKFERMARLANQSEVRS